MVDKTALKAIHAYNYKGEEVKVKLEDSVKETANDLYSALPSDIYSPEIRFALEGYSFKAVPNNWFTKLLWKFLNVKVEIEEPARLSELLPRVEFPKFELKVKISELPKPKKVKNVRKH